MLGVSERASERVDWRPGGWPRGIGTVVRLRVVAAGAISSKQRDQRVGRERQHPAGLVANQLRGTARHGSATQPAKSHTPLTQDRYNLILSYLPLRLKRAFLLFLHFSLPYPPPLPPLFSTFWGGEVDLLIASQSPHAIRQRARSCARQKELTNSMGRACVVLTSANRESDTQGVCRDGGSSVIHSDNSTRALISRVHVVGTFRFL